MRHGTEYAYRKKGCRCDQCVAYKAGAWQRYRDANATSLVERDRLRNAENPAKRNEGRWRASARTRGVSVVDFAPELLAGRLSMFSGCWMCGALPTEVDHVKPLAAGGPHMLANLRPICGPCNRSKGSRWPLTA